MALKLGELKAAVDQAVAEHGEDVDVLVRFTANGDLLFGDILAADCEHAHDDAEAAYFAIDVDGDDPEDVGPASGPHESSR